MEAKKICICKIPEPKIKVSERGIVTYCLKCAKTYRK